MIDKRAIAKENQVLSVVLLEALEGRRSIPACKVRKVVGMVYSVCELLPRHGDCKRGRQVVDNEATSFNSGVIKSSFIIHGYSWISVQ